MAVFEKASKAEIEAAVQEILGQSPEPLDFAAVEKSVAAQLGLKSGMPVRKAAWRLFREKKVKILPGMRLIKN